MGVYSNTEILRDLESGNIVIDPFNESQVNGSSYDVRLGEYFYVINDDKDLKSVLFNPYDKEQIAEHFKGPYRAKKIGELVTKQRVQMPRNLHRDKRGIVLQPGQRILGHTEEFIGIIQGTTSMQVRSSLGRLGISTCLDAGWGDPGYVNRWTMEIYNNNTNDAVLLAIGTRVAQIVFHATGFVEGEYTNLSGHYQPTSAKNLHALKDAWRPTMMVPHPLTLD